MLQLIELAVMRTDWWPIERGCRGQCWSGCSVTVSWRIHWHYWERGYALKQMNFDETGCFGNYVPFMRVHLLQFVNACRVSQGVPVSGKLHEPCSWEDDSTLRWLRNSPRFMELEVSLQCSQKLAISSHRERGESSLHSFNHILSDPF
jgi:hypothetical protein